MRLFRSAGVLLVLFLVGPPLCGCGSPRDARPPVVLDLSPTVYLDGRGDTAAVMGTDFSSAGDPRWRAFLVERDGRPRLVQSGEGIPTGLALSPTGSRLLVAWREPADGEREPEHRVTVLDLTDDNTVVADQFTHESILSPFFGATCWNSDGTAWLSLRPGDCYLIHREGHALALPRVLNDPGVGHTILRWLSDSGDSAYHLASDGVVHCITPSLVSSVMRVPVGEDVRTTVRGRATAVGEALFLLSENQLTRADLTTKSVATKALQGLSEGGWSARHVLAVSGETLVVAALKEEGDVEHWNVYALHFPTLRRRMLASLSVPESSGILSIGGDPERIWIAYPDGSGEKTLLTSRSLPRWEE